MGSLKLIIVLFVVIAAGHFLATLNHWYWTYKWLDIPMHFLGGLWLAMVYFHFVRPQFEITKYPAVLEILLAVAFVMLFGVLWEFYEFVRDAFFSRTLFWGSQFVLEKRIDVIKDLFFDWVGGLTLAVFQVL